nr:MAG TPA: hypothetical protein [Caudoviricetes sp.]
MITDDMIKQRFIHDTMSKGINTIFEAQERTVNTYLNKRSGDLAEYLSRNPFTNSSGVGKEIFYIRILSYLRFLDIHYRRGKDRISRHIRSNLSLYNRVVWGVLYHETFPELQNGLYDSIRAGIRKELEDALTYEQSQNW